jgi:hypothetical protein
METAELEKRLGVLEAAHTDLQRTIETTLKKSLDQWDLARFTQGETDLRWAKEQATAVAQGSALLSGAILTASKLIALDQLWFFGTLAAQAMIAAYWEYRLHRFAKETRERVNGLLRDVGKQSDSNKTDNHVILALALCALIVAAAAFAVAAPLLPRGIH